MRFTAARSESPLTGSETGAGGAQRGNSVMRLSGKFDWSCSLHRPRAEAARRGALQEAWRTPPLWSKSNAWRPTGLSGVHKNRAFAIGRANGSCRTLCPSRPVAAREGSARSVLHGDSQQNDNVNPSAMFDYLKLKPPSAPKLKILPQRDDPKSGFQGARLGCR